MNSSCAPPRPRRRNSLMIRLPAAWSTWTFKAATTTAATAETQPIEVRRMAFLSLRERRFREGRNETGGSAGGYRRHARLSNRLTARGGALADRHGEREHQRPHAKLAASSTRPCPSWTA